MPNYSTTCSFCGSSTGQVCKCGESVGLPPLTNTPQPTDLEMILLIRTLYSNLSSIYSALQDNRVDEAMFGIGVNVGTLYNFLNKYNYPVFKCESRNNN